jgi:transketolase
MRRNCNRGGTRLAVATDRQLETLAINTIRMLSIDAVQKANSGHPGLPMGAAAMGYVIFNDYLKHNPKNPAWFDRDRFVLSAGHGSMLLYSLLHLTGYELPLEELKNFRQLGSMTPGHPERGHTPGVEVTTGPLGQGFANGVGMAIAEAYLAARYNRPGHEIIDHITYGIVSDGDVMEGVAMEAASIAGHLQLGKLIYLYDQNEITLAATANVSFTEDVPARFEGMGWHVQTIDGMDPDAVRAAIDAAKAVTDKPSLICCQTVIGYGSPNKANSFGAHGSPLGPDEVLATKRHLGWPSEEPFFLPEDAVSHFREAIDRGAEQEAAWNERFAAYEAAHPELAAELKAAIAGELAPDWDSELPVWSAGDKPIATRKASEAVIQAFFKKVPTFIGGSADLNPSTNTAMKGAGDFEPPATKPAFLQGTTGGEWSYAGRNIHWGIREHAMGSAANGMAAHGGVIPFTATFHVFSDYMRPAVRLAALSDYKTIFVFTHDSVAVGEDGPTHEPVEQTMSLRLIPNLRVIRPADANETAHAWRLAIEHDGPSALVLSRQDLPILDQSQAQGDASRGGYILADAEGGAPEVVLISTGSEVALAMEAREALAADGVSARVVSLPSWEIFEQQGAAYEEQVLGPAGTPRVTVEAGVTIGWERYAGSNGRVIGLDRFGASAPGKKVLEVLGFTKERVAATALRLLGKDDLAEEYEPVTDGETVGTQPAGSDGHS